VTAESTLNWLGQQKECFEPTLPNTVKHTTAESQAGKIPAAELHEKTSEAENEVGVDEVTRITWGRSQVEKCRLCRFTVCLEFDA
jgi:hypothetical protein